MAKAGRRLTPALEEQILGYIRAGGYPHVAAEAAGVSQDRFADWLERGRQPNAREPYRSFARHVSQAAAQARLKAEIEARDKDPRFWLRYGPGRETPDSPGWTGQVKPTAGAARGTADVLTSPEWGQAWFVILSALESFPEARAAAAEAMNRLEPAPDPPRRLPR
jgi:hypothetical protein